MKAGELLTEEELDEIKSNFRITRHAREKMLIRSNLVVPNDERKTIENIREAIDNYVLAYYNTDGSVNIAINRWNYFVFTKGYNCWILLTYKEPSLYGKDIYEKRKMAVDGFDRKY